jgi:hypothetical protein
MAQRDELFKKFGPLMLEAFMIMVLDETNRLRKKLNMQQLTPQDVLNEINNHLSTLPPYDWMQDAPRP